MIRRFTAAALTLAAAAGLAACGSATPADGLQVGQCFTEEALGAGVEVTEIETVECTQPHEHEVYATPALEFDAWPGEGQINTAALEACIAEFEGYVGSPYETSTVFAWALLPSEEGWASGDTSAACIAETETRSSSVEGSGE
ncbi:MAG: septum formation family protein [bacterium]|nr:septum formation family protein [bacterium]